MDRPIKAALLRAKIRNLRRVLDNAIEQHKVNCDKLLRISRQLDTLIVSYYNLYKGS
ncbi:MAG: Spo0E family sporulation regulatory protein-aspartic acid phosphatase [Acetivibrionales bacterium]|jgi:hypothetical protein